MTTRSTSKSAIASGTEPRPAAAASSPSVTAPAATDTDTATAELADAPPAGAESAAPQAGVTITAATTAAAALHDLRQLVVGDLVLRVAPPSDRKTIEIVVERDAALTLKAPRSASVRRAEQFVKAKQGWIYRKLADKDALTGPPVVKQFVDGEGFAYLGRNYRLTLTTGPATGVRMEGGRFHLPAAQAGRGAALMRRWYTETGGQWLQRRVRPWAARIGEQDVAVEVRDLGYRWGSARRTDGPQRINVHWATLQLPPTLIDYVLVHELAHLHELNHTPDFWATVARLMPTFEQQRASLSATGNTVWLGTL